MEEKKKLIAPCGLDCMKCDARIATINDDDALREKTARLWCEWNNTDVIKPEHINCMGCLTEGVKTCYCAELCEIRKCALAKGLATCAGCVEKRTCSVLAELKSDEAKANLGM